MTRHRHTCGHVHECEAPEPAQAGADLRAALIRLAYGYVSPGDRGSVGLQRQAQQQAERIVDLMLPTIREAALRPFEELFSGGPDTACRTTYRDDSGAAPELEVPPTECVEVPLDDLRAAFDDAGGSLT